MSERDEVIDECKRQVRAAWKWAHGSETMPETVDWLVQALDGLKVYEPQVTDVMRLPPGYGRPPHD